MQRERVCWHQQVTLVLVSSDNAMWAGVGKAMQWGSASGQVLPGCKSAVGR